MGVPALFRWLSQKYPKIVSSVIEEEPQMVGDQEVPIDFSRPNPNGEELDNLYLDMNGIVHPCSHPEDRPPPADEEEMMSEIFKYTERVVNMVRPRKLLLIAVDGVAPRAKMNQQRSRRFRSAQEAKEKEQDTADLIKLLEQQRGTKVDESIKDKKVWDSNAITPGTPFMDILAASLKYWAQYKLSTDPAWANLKIIISDSTVPGEGEHKIMEFIRSQRANPQHDPNTRHVIYGLDADLIMLGLGTHEPHFRVLREDVFAADARKRTCRICGQEGHMADECTGKAKEKVGEFDEKSKAETKKPFIWLHVSVLREYLEVELKVYDQGFKFDLERALDDWVFMCFFVGNDFLPHLPSLEIRDGGIDTLIAIWKDNLAAMGGYLTKDGSVDLKRVQYILDGLAKQEDDIFRRRKQAEDRREANAKRRRLNDEQRSGSNRNTRGGPRYSGGVSGYENTITNTPTPATKKGKTGPPTEPPPMIPVFRPGDKSKDTKKLNHTMVVNRDLIRKANLENKSAAAALKSQLLGGTGDGASTSVESPVNGSELEGDAAVPDAPVPETPESIAGTKRKADEIEEGETLKTEGAETPKSETASLAEANPDTVRLWEPGYRDRYYEQKFHVKADDHDFRQKVAAAYVEGLCWVLLYYFQGCPSWTWFYPYHYAPFAQDFKDVDTLKIKFEKGKPCKPFEQLMGVLPAASKHNLPTPFHKLMTEPDSEIIDFYPENFPIDLNGKKFQWQGVALLPFIEEQRLLDAANKIYPTLTPEDAARNAMGSDYLYIADGNPLYDDVAGVFYSKRQDVTDYNLNPRKSAGLAGLVKKDPDYIPRSFVSFPLASNIIPDLEEDRSLQLAYVIPKSKNVHKSMLLRGVKFNPPALSQGDKEAVKNKAQNSGRSYGGANLYRGGGGRGSFRSDRDRGPGYGGAAHGGQSQGYGGSGQGFGGFGGLPPPPPPGQWGQGQWGNGQWGNGQFPPLPMPGQFGAGFPPPPPGVRLGGTFPANAAPPPPRQQDDRYRPGGSGYGNGRGRGGGHSWGGR